ncbi:DegV family protein [Petrocella sp. FN5]|uniref:DegV family protein n=1 Tax=Petrocella sp. FN5 TaxID=3032002 RepID=UPI0023DB8976|nr:DegV family protein [Petrocella sp. FN5]MDF1617724.1 DegV family protein [Petrocella sp. FN5]
MIKLMADSTCDLSDAILEKYNISMAPLSILIEDQSYKDRVDIQPGTLYNILGTLKNLPTTGMPSPTEYIDIIEASIDQGYTEILCICMSSGTSGSYQSALLALEYFEEKYGETPYKMHVVDSKCMSHGSGYLLLKSALLREQGATFDELVDFNETYKTNVKHLLSVDDLDNLIKSGRLTNVSAMIGKVLKVKPIMSMRNGKGAIVAKVRGRKKVFAHYVESFINRVDLELTDFVIIGYTSDLTVAENMKLKLENETDFTGDIYIMQMGVSVGTHVGLGALSMYFFEKGDRHDGLVYNEMSALMDKKNEMIKLIRSLKDKN